MSEPKTQADWSRENEAKRMRAGARRMPGGMLPADAAKALDELRGAGYAPTLVGCIARALIAAAKNH